MGNIMILNGSPRAPKSNSKEYARLFQESFPGTAEYFAVAKDNHFELCKKLEGFAELLLVFPLYADSIPVPLLHFLKTLEENPPKRKPRISVLINCGFLEPEQNDTAVKMIQFFCKSQGYPFASVLRIGGGEAILTTPFQRLVKRKIKKLALSMAKGEPVSLKTTMPMPKRLFVKASAGYWEKYGKRNGVTREEMSTMEIEKETRK